MADRPQQVGRHIGVRGACSVRLDAVSDQLVADVRGDDLGVAARRPPRSPPPDSLGCCQSETRDPVTVIVQHDDH
jgi:hypothetical protein